MFLFLVTDSKIQQLNHYLFLADINGSHDYRVHIQTQKSATLGIRKMHNQYRQKKLDQIQELSILIMEYITHTPDINSTLESSPRGDYYW
jgi:hypothetical protein